MDDIQQADSLIETSLHQEDPVYQLRLLFHENTLLREELKKISSKLDAALSSLPFSQPRVQSPELRAPSPPALLKIAFGAPLIKTLEKKIELLEIENNSLKQKIEKTHYMPLDNQIHGLFQRHSNFLKKVFRTESILNKISADIKENNERINKLNSKVINSSSDTPQTPSFGMKTACFPEVSIEKTLENYQEKEKRLKQELEIVNEELSSKRNQLDILEEMNRKYANELKSLEKTRNNEKLRFKEVFSPNLTKKLPVSGSEKILRNRPRFHSNKQKIENEKLNALNALRHSGSLEPINRQGSGGNGRNTGMRKSVEKIFKGIKLGPDQFEFTQNFTKAFVMGKK